MPLSSAMEDGGFNHIGDSGSGGSPAAAAVVVVAAVDNRDRWQWRLMVAAALDGGHATTSLRSKRAAQREYKRAAQGEATQQSANLLPLCY